MSLLLGPLQKHIPGRKSLTDHSDVKDLMPKEKVYIPLFAGPVTTYTLCVEEGSHVDIGTKLADTKAAFEVPLYSSVSGTFTGLVKRPHNSMKPQLHFEIVLDKEQTQVQAFEPMDWEKASQPEMVDFMKKTGIIGQGGAGFPTYVKYMNPKGITTLIINAVECEPYITADYKSIMDSVEDFIHGCRIMLKMSTGKECLIAIKESHPDLIDYVNREIKKEGLSDVKVAKVPDVYPMGGERTLVRTLLGKNFDRLPAEVGAIVNNANTAILTARAFEKGEAISKKFLTFSGEALNYPTNVRVPVGMEVGEIIEAIGGIDPKLPDCKVISGGPMMGKTMVNTQFTVDRAMNAITVLPNKEEEALTCMRCGRCTAHCPIGLQPVRIANAVKMNDTAEMEKRGAMACIECGMCTYVCPSKIQVTENVRKAKRTLAMKNRKKGK